MICRQIIIYLFGLDLYFKNAVVAIEDKQEDVFINMLEVVSRSRNELLKNSVINMFERNVMESGEYNLGFSKSYMNDTSIYGALKSSDIIYDKNYLRTVIA